MASKKTKNPFVALSEKKYGSGSNKSTTANSGKTRAIDVKSAIAAFTGNKSGGSGSSNKKSGSSNKKSGSSNKKSGSSGKDFLSSFLDKEIQNADRAGSSSAGPFIPSSTPTNPVSRSNDNNSGDFGSSNQGGFSPGDFATIFENLSTAQQNLANIQGGFSVQAAQIGANASVASANLRADADKEVARAYADAQKFSSERGLEGTKYVADRESEWRKAVADIEVKGRLDLQPIINSGIQRVAEIEGLTQRDVANITGKFNVEATKTRSDADERISKVQLAGNLYGLINSVFG